MGKHPYLAKEERVKCHHPYSPPPSCNQAPILPYPLSISKLITTYIPWYCCLNVESIIRGGMLDFRGQGVASFRIRKQHSVTSLSTAKLVATSFVFQEAFVYFPRMLLQSGPRVEDPGFVVPRTACRLGIGIGSGEIFFSSPSSNETNRIVHIKEWGGEEVDQH